MRVLISPDSFTGSLSAPQAAVAIARGWSRTSPGDELMLRPLSDGGPGFVDTLAAAVPGRLIEVDTRGPWGAPATGHVLVSASAPVTAYLEVAQAAGDTGAAPGPAGAASSLGVAALLEAALDAGAERVVVGLGGTLVSDGGAGLLAGLGARALDPEGGDATGLLLAGGAGLSGIDRVDLQPARSRLADVELVIASDVDAPLLGPRGAARGFGPQKGADPELVEVLETSLRAFAHACGRLPDGRSPAVQLGAGAAGGLGFALLHLGGRRVPGIAEVLDIIGFDEALAACDLVVTGEGCLDWQSLSGKVITGVCDAAMARGRPVLVLAGRVEVGRREWMAIGVSGAYAILADGAGRTLQDAMAAAPELLSDLAERAARTWSH